VALEHLPAHHGPVHIALGIDTDAFRAGVVRRRRLHVLDERRDGSILRAADPNALPDAHELVRAGVGARLRISHVDGVVFGDVDPARTSKLPAFGDVLSILVEDLDPIVFAIADEQAPAGIEGDGVRLADLAGTGALPAPLPDVLSVLRELHDPIVLAAAVAVGDEDISVRCHDNVAGLVEEIRA